MLEGIMYENVIKVFKQCHNAMVEAIELFKLYPTFMSYMY
jgi:hypothetical protein